MALLQRVGHKWLPLIVLSILPSCAGESGARRDPAGNLDRTMKRLDTMSVDQVESTRKPRLTRAQLQARVMGFVDRYIARIEQATDSLEVLNTDPAKRLLIQGTKMYPTMSAIQIATDPDPVFALLNMAVMVTLERTVWGEGWAEHSFGENAYLLTDAQKSMERDVWSIVADVFTPEQVEKLRALIADWRKANPDVEYVSTVRFDQIASLRSSDEAENFRRAQGLLAPVDEATRALEDVRGVGERALFAAQRMPLIITWQVEALIYDVALAPEVSRVLTGAETISKSADRFATVAEKLPDQISGEREILLSELDKRTETLRSAIGEVRGLLSDTSPTIEAVRATSETFRDTVQSVDSLVARMQAMQGPDGKGPGGFDIEAYSRAAQELAIAVKEMNSLVTGTEGLLGSANLTSRLDELNRNAAERLDQASTRATFLIVLFWLTGLATLITYRILCHYLRVREKRHAAA